MEIPFDEDDHADRFFEEILAAVDQQLVSPQTPYVAKTLDRLLKAGMEADEAREAIACCLLDETERVLRSKKPFDEAAYRRSLDSISPGS